MILAVSVGVLGYVEHRKSTLYSGFGLYVTFWKAKMTAKIYFIDGRVLAAGVNERIMCIGQQPSD